MASGPDEVKGLKELSDKLNELVQVMGVKPGRSILRSAVKYAVQPVAERAQATAPVRDEEGAKKTYKGSIRFPGFLQRSVATKVVVTRDGRFKAMVGVKPEAYYGLAFVERGTRFVRAQPWLVPTFEASQGAMISRLKEKLAKRIKQVAAKGRK